MENEQQTLDILEEYYFKHPSVLLDYWSLSLAFISIILYLLIETRPPNMETWLISFAYVSMILAISISEIFIWKWRRKRDNDLVMLDYKW